MSLICSSRVYLIEGFMFIGVFFLFNKAIYFFPLRFLYPVFQQVKNFVKKSCHYFEYYKCKTLVFLFELSDLGWGDFFFFFKAANIQQYWICANNIKYLANVPGCFQLLWFNLCGFVWVATMRGVEVTCVSVHLREPIKDGRSSYRRTGGARRSRRASGEPRTQTVCSEDKHQTTTS